MEFDVMVMVINKWIGGYKLVLVGNCYFKLGFFGYWNIEIYDLFLKVWEIVGDILVNFEFYS